MCGCHSHKHQIELQILSSVIAVSWDDWFDQGARVWRWKVETHPHPKCWVLGSHEYVTSSLSQICPLSWCNLRAPIYMESNLQFFC
jgi:hypothetical protein